MFYCEFWCCMNYDIDFDDYLYCWCMERKCDGCQYRNDDELEGSIFDV